MLQTAKQMHEQATILIKQANHMEQKAELIVHEVHQSLKRKHEKEDILNVLDMKIQHLEARRKRLLGTPMSLEQLPEGIQIANATEGARKGKIVKATTDGGYIVQYVDDPKVTRGHDDMELVRPVKNDKVVIVKGDQKNAIGTLIGIDGTDGIIKFHSNSDIKILDFNLCAKLAD